MRTCVNGYPVDNNFVLLGIVKAFWLQAGGQAALHLMLKQTPAALTEAMPVLISNLQALLFGLN